jgi:hypothetical protein
MRYRIERRRSKGRKLARALAGTVVAITVADGTLRLVQASLWLYEHSALYIS